MMRFILFLMLAIAPIATAAEPRVDAFGDPLPPGAILRLGTARFRHGDAILAMVISPDGKTLVTAGGSAVRAWDAGSGQLRFAARDISLPATFPITACLAISPDSRILACGCGDGTVRFWDLPTGRERKTYPARMGKEPAVAVSFMPDGRRLLVGYQWPQGHIIGMINEVPLDESEWRWASLVRGGPWVHVGRDGRIWMQTPDAADGKQNLVSFDHLISEKNKRELTLRAKADAIAVSPDGKWVAVVMNGVVCLYDAVSGKETPFESATMATALAFSPDSTILATAGSDSQIVFWDPTTRTKRREIGHTVAAGTALAFSPDGKTLFAGDRAGILSQWDTATGRETSLVAGSNRIVTATRAPDGRIASAAADGTVDIWDANGKKIVRLNSGDRVQTLAFTSGQNQLAAVTSKGHVAIWDVAATKIVREWDLPDVRNRPRALIVCSPDGRWLALGESLEATVRLWDLPTGKMVRQVNCDQLAHVAFSADGRCLATVDAFNNECIWNVAGKSEMIARWEGANGYFVEALEVSPDGRRLATCGRKGPVVVREVGGTTKIMKVPGDMPSALRFSPDGLWLIAVADNGEILLLDSERGEIAHKLIGHEGPVRQLEFSRGLRTLLTVGNDSTALLWDLRPEPPKAKPTLEVLWNDLADKKAVQSYKTFWQLVEQPGATPFLREKLAAELKGFDSERIRRWLAELDDRNFKVRENASRELAKLGPAFAQLLRRELEQDNSPEKRRRLLRLVANLPAERPSFLLRQARAVSVLAEIGSLEARAALKELAAGPAEVELVRCARAALK